MKTNRIFPLIAIAVLTACSAYAEDLQAIEGRIIQRLPVITELKTKQVVGENNQGYLEFRGAREKADVVDAENADRQAVYQSIAAKTGAPIATVSRQRAEEIRRQSKSGVMVQLPNGAWIEK